jgi:hypothetical protein
VNHIITALKVNKSLNEFGIHGNPIGLEGVMSIGMMFREHDSSLKTIWLGNIPDRKDWYLTLANSLQKEPNLTSLDLKLSDLRKDEAQNFKYLLDINPKIKLVLSDNLTPEIKELLKEKKDKIQGVTW